MTAGHEGEPQKAVVLMFDFGPVRRLAPLPLCVAVLACGTPIDVATLPFLGSYEASQILIVDTGDSTDYLALGGHWDMTIEENDAITIDVHLPGAADDGSDITATAITTWRSTLFALSGGGTATVVEVRRGDASAPPFVYDLAWLVGDDVLSTERFQCSFTLIDTPAPNCLFRIVLRRVDQT